MFTALIRGTTMLSTVKNTQNSNLLLVLLSGKSEVEHAGRWSTF